MFRKYIIIAVLALPQLSTLDCFKITIARDLFSTKVLGLEKWSYVKVVQNHDVFDIEVEIPKELPFTDIYIFFGSDSKEILQVNFNSIIRGTYYTTPYKMVKEIEGGKLKTAKNDKFQQVSGQIPVSWLPKNCSFISATVKESDMRFYNYYGIQNSEISIPDLMVVEEFKSFKINEH